MIEFEYIWLLGLIPLPFILTWILPEHRESRPSVKLPFFDDLIKLTGASFTLTNTESSTIAQKLSIWFSWLLLIVALARPQYIEEAVTKTVASRDLLLAIDLSGSMETEDFKNSSGKQVTRLAATKEVLYEFLEKREGDRVSLIFFGSAAFIQMPFTEDLKTCQILLDEAQVRMAGPQTKIGDAIGLAITIFERSELQDKVLIMLTDGNDTGSQILPEKAAEIAKQKGIVIHTIAVGDPKAAGEEVLDEKTLKNISATTEGRYYRADDREQMAKIYDEIDRIGARDLETISHRPKRELYFWPLSMFLCIAMLFHFVKLWTVFSALNKHKKA